MYRPLIHSIGIEIEFANLPKELLRSGNILNHAWRLVEDGSCRNYHPSYDGVFKSREGGRVMFGGELVSPILDVTKDGWEKDMYEILTCLYEWGEGIDARTSIHIHINSAGLPVYALQYLFQIGAYLEDALYRLSIAEAGIHRGEVMHDYGYCRPITDDGPPVTACYDGYNRPIYTLENLLNSKTIDEFRLACGRYDRYGGKYHEARYTWLNPLAIFQHGSMEFRLWNMTRHPRYVIAWVHVCMDMVRASLGKRGELPANPLGSGSIGLDDLMGLLEPDDKVAYVLEELWELGRQCPPIRNPQFGHLGHEINWANTPNYLVPPRAHSSASFNRYDQENAVILKEGFTIIPYTDHTKSEPRNREPRNSESQDTQQEESLESIIDTLRRNRARRGREPSPERPTLVGEPREPNAEEPDVVGSEVHGYVETWENISTDSTTWFYPNNEGDSE